MKRRRNSAKQRPAGLAVLTIDATAAHVTISSEWSAALYDFLCGEGIACRLCARAAVNGQDLVDFGNPSAAQETTIRRVFERWCRLAAQVRPVAPCESVA
jgi:hypothetical protein